MGKWFRRFIVFILFVLVLLALAGWGLLRYIAPQEQLDLSYAPVPFEQKAKDMALQLKPELILTEDDLNQLIKGYLSGNRDLAPDVKLDGARFELDGDLLTAYVNVTYRDRIAAAAVAEYRLVWDKPDLKAVPAGLSVRSFQLPAEGLKEIVIPLGRELPEWLEVTAVHFDPDRLRVAFKANVPDMGGLLERLKP